MTRPPQAANARRRWPWPMSTGPRQVTVSSNPHKRWAQLALALTIASAPALLSAQITLATAVDLAQRKSASVKLAQADVQRAQAALAQTKDAFIPTVELGSGLPAMPAVGFTGGVPSILNGNVQTMIFSLPQFQYIKAARAALAAAALNLKSAREQVALDTSTAYIELDTVNRELDAARQQESFADRLVGIEQERTEAGVDALRDLLQARLTAAQLKLSCLHLETRAATLAEQLATLTGASGWRHRAGACQHSRDSSREGRRFRTHPARRAIGPDASALQGNNGQRRPHERALSANELQRPLQP